jgi:hypothetical protein
MKPATDYLIDVIVRDASDCEGRERPGFFGVVNIAQERRANESIERFGLAGENRTTANVVRTVCNRRVDLL